MGMMYKGKPSKSWELLIELTKRNGRIDYVTDLGDVEYLKQKDKLQKRFRDLRKKLESIFDVKIKKGRDYSFYKILDFKAIAWRDNHTPEILKYVDHMARETRASDMINNHMDDIKKNGFYNSDQYSDDY
jgi:hypothetical protein